MNDNGSVDVQYSVESSTVDVDPTPELGDYAGGLLTISLQLGSQQLVIDPSGAANNSFYALDNFPLSGSPVDQYSALVIDGAATLAGTPLDLDLFVVSLSSSDTSIFGSDALPAAQPSNSVSEWDRLNFLQVQGTLGADTFLIDAVVIETPEPGTGALVGFGLIALARGRRSLANRE